MPPSMPYQSKWACWQTSRWNFPKSAHSDLLERGDLLFVLIVEGLRKQLEWLIDVTALKSTHFTEFKPDSHGEGVTVFRTDLDPAVEVHLIRDNDA